jgi:hypothetical protein
MSGVKECHKLKLQSVVHAIILTSPILHLAMSPATDFAVMTLKFPPCCLKSCSSACFWCSCGISQGYSKRISQIYINPGMKHPLSNDPQYGMTETSCLPKRPPNPDTTSSWNHTSLRPPSPFHPPPTSLYKSNPPIHLLTPRHSYQTNINIPTSLVNPPNHLIQHPFTHSLTLVGRMNGHIDNLDIEMTITYCSDCTDCFTRRGLGDYAT